MKKTLLSLLLIFFFIIYTQLASFDYDMPVKGAKRNSYNQKSFWAYPWGTSGHHKGVDIFAKKGTPVLSATTGLVVYKGVLSKGGNVIMIVDPKLKFHYYAHLDKVTTHSLSIMHAGDPIGTVGTTGNAKGKPPHLHYSIGRIIPRIFSDEEWDKRFYDDPVIYLNQTN